MARSKASAAEIARYVRRTTPARRKALDVMRRSHPRWTCISNRTVYATSTSPALVYWQTARWLVDAGLAQHRLDGHGREYVSEIELTPLGLDVAHKAAAS